MTERGADDSFVPQEELVLEPVGVDAAAVARAETRRVYQHPYSVYVHRWGLGKNGERTVKRWVQRGREASPQDLPPLDEAHRLAGWWRKHMKWGVPEWMEQLEQLGPRGADRQPIVEARSDQAPSLGVVRSEEKKGDEAGALPDLPPSFDLEAMPADAGDAERELWSFANGFKDEMKRARERHDNDKWWSAYNEYMKLIKQIRAWEKDRMAKRMQAGTALDVATMTEILTLVFSGISKTFTGCLLDLAKKLAPEMTDQQVRALVYPMRDKMFQGVKETKFVVALPPEVAA